MEREGVGVMDERRIVRPAEREDEACSYCDKSAVVFIGSDSNRDRIKCHYCGHYLRLCPDCFRQLSNEINESRI